MESNDSTSQPLKPWDISNKSGGVSSFFKHLPKTPVISKTVGVKAYLPTKKRVEKREISQKKTAIAIVKDQDNKRQSTMLDLLVVIKKREGVSSEKSSSNDTTEPVSADTTELVSADTTCSLDEDASLSVEEDQTSVNSQASIDSQAVSRYDIRIKRTHSFTQVSPIKEWLEDSQKKKKAKQIQMNDADPTPLITDPLAPTPLIDSSLTSKNTPVPSHNEAVAAASGIVSNASILSYSTRPPKHTRQRTLASFNFTKERTVKKASRVISQTPTKVLDAPFMVDDYYLNLLDWSCHNVVAIALERSVYLWNAESGTTTLLDTDSDESVTSLIWSEDGTMLAVAKDNGTTDLWDAYQNTRLRSMEGPNCRVGVLSWDKCIVSGGAQNGIIYNHDVRLKEHKVSEWAGHDEEVCGLEWRSDGGFLASGGNDNLINVWDNRFTTPIMTRREHISAVKALAWCPWNPNILASGGGRDDKKIHFWDTIKNKIITTFTADSQITSLQWSLQHREIASTHGMPHNNIIVWDYDTGNTIADIKAHDSRILHSALSPDGEVLATSSADENLKFWTIFEQKNTTLQANTEKKIANRLKRTGSLR